MKNQLLFLIAAILSLNGYSQISFENGYYIDNNNQKIDCLIKNMDWLNNPTEFEYKLSENSEPQIATAASVKEFGVNNLSKYINRTVNIDRTGGVLNNLGYEKNPVFNKETLFLKVLVESKSNLYEYIDGNLRIYFYTKEDSNIEQLISKNYKISDGKIGKNNSFRQQLWNDLKCPNFKLSKIERINYNKNELVKFFTEYSQCHNDELIDFEPKQKRDAFNLTIRPRLNNSSSAVTSAVSYSRNTNLGSKMGFGAGLEAEIILPFNKNKWAIALEPTYQSFKSEKTINNVSNVSGGILITSIDYSSIEVPLSLRHYLFLNKDSKLFINASYVFDFNSKSSYVELRRADNSILNTLEVKTSYNLAFGIGYKLYDTYSVEMRYLTSRELLGGYNSWSADYKTLSIILGYSLF